ncbi:MAG: AraC family transcriptional regulator [Chloroflexota bacterium]
MITHYFNSITEANQFLDLPKPEHPLFFVHVDTRTSDEAQTTTLDEPIALSNNFYSIGFKNVLAGEMQYGRTKYDLTNGTMIFTAPRQQVIASGMMTVATNASIFIHEDFIRGHEIQRRIKEYHFFDYATNEALHLTPKEERLILTLFESVETEYHNNPDQFSKEILLSYVDTILNHSQRFYQRQFLHRQEAVGSVVSQFTQILAIHFESGAFELEGTPRVEEIAQEMSMSSRYLSDALKAESGKTAIENIHLYLMDEAKNLLLEPQMTVAETAYKLGFETPQYFSRLFKKKVGLSPTAYQAQHSLN